MTMRLSARYGSHIPVLLKLLPKTNGDILELGMGVFSTPLLHYWCAMHGQLLVSYDNSLPWSNWSQEYEGEYHKIVIVDDWSNADIERPWDIALIDHSPDGRRKDDVRRLANFAKYVVLHDANRRFNRHFGYTEIYPLFKYKKDWIWANPHTTVLSNLTELEELW